MSGDSEGLEALIKGFWRGVWKAEHAGKDKPESHGAFQRGVVVKKSKLDSRNFQANPETELGVWGILGVIQARHM